MNTLIVEDNAAFRKSLRVTLSSRFPKMSIYEASQWDEVSGFLERVVPDIVFLDIQLPGGSGLELVSKIKDRCSTACIVILTSHDLPEYREAAARLGASCFLCKGKAGPAEIEELVMALGSANHRNGTW